MVDEIFSLILSLDEKQRREGNPRGSLSDEVIKRYYEIEEMINKLSLIDKKLLFKKVDEEVSCNINLYPRIILKYFHESIRGRIFVEEKSIDINKISRI